MKPLYIWAGGKNKMIPKYQGHPTIPLSGYDTYVEPFFGGGAMMIHVYKNNSSVKKFILNDINEYLVGIYTAIKYDVDNFVKRMDELQSQFIPLTKIERKKFYYLLRDEYTLDYEKYNKTVDSATLYFLMKTGFNGIWQSTKIAKGRFATPSGLLNQKDVCYDKANVYEWHEFLQKVDIYSGSWEHCVDKIDGKAFYFFDPPYRDSFTQYDQVFDDTQHIELIDFCKQQDLDGHYVYYCNRESNDSFYTDNKGHLDISYHDVTYTAGRRATNNTGKKEAKAATEILLYSPSINLSNPMNLIEIS